MKADAYSLGKDAGWREFYSRVTQSNPYACGGKDHNDFELGWVKGYDEALDQFEFDDGDGW